METLIPFYIAIPLGIWCYVIGYVVAQCLRSTASRREKARRSVPAPQCPVHRSNGGRCIWDLGHVNQGFTYHTDSRGVSWGRNWQAPTSESGGSQNGPTR